MAHNVFIVFVQAHITVTSNIIRAWWTRVWENRRGYGPLSFNVSFLRTMYLIKFYSSRQWLDIGYVVMISEDNMFALCILFHSVVLCLISSTGLSYIVGRLS